MNSAANPETLADIVREMREYDETPPPKRAWLDLADRIEATAAREMSKGLSKKLDKNHDIPGNSAAMREALLNARTRFASITLTGSEWRTCAESHVREIDAALAAPPRNCDRFANSRDAIVAFKNEIDCLKEGGADYSDLAAWLFSRAKGGAE